MSKKYKWDEIVLKIGNTEIKGVAPLSYKESVKGEAGDLPTFKYSAVIELTKEDYERLEALGAPLYDEEASDKRINAIGQNGNTGEHYKPKNGDNE